MVRNPTRLVLATCLSLFGWLAANSAADPPSNPAITIDASKTGQPISKYVYGQFIEHLGRCIYGGIWAEMLQDRKFYYPVGAKESPWKLVGKDELVKMLPEHQRRALLERELDKVSSVKMERQQPFVGQQTPQVSGGLYQDGIGLRKGKRYVGHIWLAGPNEAPTLPAQGVYVSLIWGRGPSDRQNVPIRHDHSDFEKHSFNFTAGGDTEDGKLQIVGMTFGSFRVGTVSLMPADNIDGMRADTLALLKELDSPVYRWPGGNFVSGYNWKDGIGPRDRRPPRKNPAWKGIEHNDFGLDEFMTYCRYLKTDPYIAVNSGLGDVKAAVEELQYANGSPDTPMGKLRAANGHAEPYGVKFWSIGNEMYGNWQLGHMTLAKYVEKHNQFAEAMRKADPSIKVIAVGDIGPWSEGMLKNCADHMDLMSEHFYCQERPDLYAHVRQIPQAVLKKAEAHRRYRQQLESLKGKDIRIALDEWNYWYGPHVFGELGTRYFLKDGLGIAAGLHEMARQSDMFYMANYAQTVNVIGCIKTNKTQAAMETTGLVLALYRKHFGTVPVATEASRPIDAMAAWSADHKTLALGVVNPTRQVSDVPLTVKGAKLRGTGKRFEMAGSDPQAHNDPADPHRVKIEESAIQGIRDKLSIAPCSVTLFVFDVE